MALPDWYYDTASSVYISDIPPEMDQGDFWAGIISSLGAVGIAAYQVVAGQPVSTQTGSTGGTVITTGPAAQAQSQQNMILMLGAIVIIVLLLYRK